MIDSYIPTFLAARPMYPDNSALGREASPENNWDTLRPDHKSIFDYLHRISAGIAYSLERKQYETSILQALFDQDSEPLYTSEFVDVGLGLTPAAKGEFYLQLWEPIQLYPKATTTLKLKYVIERTPRYTVVDPEIEIYPYDERA